MGRRDLPLVILQHHGAGAVQDADRTAVETSRMLSRVRTRSAGFNSNQADS
jgi:hypothetical protein